MVFDLNVLPIFILSVVILAITPGPDMALLIARGVGQGRKVASYTALGITLAGIVQVPFLAFGADALFRAFPWAYDALRLCGAAYLIWRGARLLSRATQAGPAGSVETAFTSPATALREGAIASLLNPKGFVFMIAFLPQFANPTLGGIAWQIAGLGILMKVMALVVELSIAVAAGSLGNWLSRNPKLVYWQERFTGAFMIALGIRLIFSAGDTRSLAHR